MITENTEHDAFIDAIYAACIANYKKHQSESIKRGLLRAKLLKATKKNLPKK